MSPKDLFILGALIFFYSLILAPLVGLVIALRITRSPFEARRRLRRTAARTLFTYYSILVVSLLASLFTIEYQFFGKTLLSLAAVLVTVGAVPVGADLVRRAREIRRADYSGFCPTCGYSVTQSGAARCPECGYDLSASSHRAG